MEVILNDKKDDPETIGPNDTLTQRICKGLKEVKRIKEGELKAKSAEDLLKELDNEIF
jgi:hypothetical protein